MLKKTITYVDYDGSERTEDFYFNLSKAEVMEMEMSTSGGLAEMITRIVAAQDNPSIIRVLMVNASLNRKNFQQHFLRQKLILFCLWNLLRMPKPLQNSLTELFLRICLKRFPM